MERVNYISANEIIELIEDYKKELEQEIEKGYYNPNTYAQVHALRVVLNDIYNKEDRIDMKEVEDGK